MTQDSGGEAPLPSQDDQKSADDAIPAKLRVARTMMDINLADLINPLTEGLAGDSDAGTKPPLKEQEKKQPQPRKVSKTLLEDSITSLDAIKDLAEAAAKTAGLEETSGQKPSKPVAKTMLDLEMLDGIGMFKSDTPETSPPKSVQKLKILKKKISKTMLEISVENLESLMPTESSEVALPGTEARSENTGTAAALPESEARSENTETASARPQVRQQFVAKTMLDHSLLLEAVSRSTAKKELEVAQRLKEKSNEPPKPPVVPIKGDRPATPCAWTWEETESKDKYRYCATCQTPVYNLAGMERPEAEALIFNRENRKKFTLYSRADGKFMTTDCPVQVKRKNDLIMLAIGAIVLVVAAITIMTLMPPAPLPAPTASTSAPNVVRRSPTSQASVNRQNGSSHFEAGQGLQTFALPAPTATTTRTADPDEDGSFWKY